MGKYIHVIPFDQALIDRYQDKVLVVRTSDPDNVRAAADAVAARNRLHAVKVELDCPLADLVVPEAWHGLPLAIHVPELGQVRNLSDRLGPLRDPQFRWFLPASRRESFQEVRILSSLGVAAGIHFDQPQVDWDALNDLMHYAVYAKPPHAPVEPFHYILSNYDPMGSCSATQVEFEHPERFLHADAQGRLAFSRHALARGEYLPETLDNLDEATLPERHKAVFEQWKSFFLKAEGCSACEGWRLCHGRHVPAAGPMPANPGCQPFYADLLDACDFVRNNQAQRTVSSWQF